MRSRSFRPEQDIAIHFGVETGDCDLIDFNHVFWFADGKVIYDNQEYEGAQHDREILIDFTSS